MKAVVFHKPKDVRVDRVPDPVLEHPRDVVACDLGSEHPGAQAELVRVPGGANLRKVPEQLTHEQALFLTDILPAGWSAIAWAGLRGGETVAMFGCGPVGIMAQKCAWLQGAKRVFAIDTLIVAGKLRADDVITHELPLERAPQAYDIFAKRTDNCVKVVLKPGMAMAA